MSMSTRLGRSAAALVLFAGVTLTSTTAMAQVNDDEPAQLLEEFLHYINVAKPELAAGFGQELLESGVSEAELARLVDEGAFDVDRIDRAFEIGRRVDSISDLVEDVASMIERGRLSLARERERILQAIEMLSGPLRSKRLGERRLVAAGEYAVPYLLDVVLSDASELDKQACLDVMVKIGVTAITPLTVALPHVDPIEQRVLVETLEQIAGRGGRGNSYRHAGPALKALAEDDTTTREIRELAAQAFDRVYGGNDSLDVLYTALADMYMNELGSLVAYPFDETNNVWEWEGFGLLPTPVPTEVFNEVMAMKSAATAIDFAAGNQEALSLYVAANLRRENELVPGDIEPVFGDNPYTPDFYATVFGTDVAQRVLGYAIDTSDTPLVRDAIAALSKTTGGSNLFGGGDRQPLVEALSYPDRRVQLEAALTLARALPATTFDGSNRVMPILSAAIRSAGESFAMVVADDEENRRVERGRLEDLGFTVIGTGGSMDEAMIAAGSNAAIDLMVVRMQDGDDAVQVTADARRANATQVTPILVVAPPVDVPNLRLEFQTSVRTAVSAPVDDAAHGAIVDELLRRASGGRLTQAQSEIYAIESLAAARDLAINNSPAFDVLQAESALLDALAARSGGTRMLVADVLALMQSSSAQRALFGAALDADASGDQIPLLERVSMSVKRYGNLSERRHVVALLDLVRSSEGAVAEAAAQVHGALNLPSGDAVGLIDGGQGG